MKNNGSLLYNIFLVIGDFLALVAAFVGAFVLRVSLSDVPIANQISGRDYIEIFLFLLDSDLCPHRPVQQQYI